MTVCMQCEARYGSHSRDCTWNPDHPDYVPYDSTNDWIEKMEKVLNEPAYDSYYLDKEILVGRKGGLPDTEIGSINTVIENYFQLHRVVYGNKRSDELLKNGGLI